MLGDRNMAKAVHFRDLSLVLPWLKIIDLNLGGWNAKIWSQLCGPKPILSFWAIAV